MGRLASVRLAIIAFLVLSSLAGCGGGSSKPFTPVPGSVRLSPGSGSIDIGSYSLQFTATTSSGGSLSSPVFTSSNPAVLTLTTTGLACGGTWDATDTVCTPGGAGVAEVTVSSVGVSSPPVTVYVHQHIDRIALSAVPISPGSLLPYTLPNAPQWPNGSQCYTTLAGSLTTAQAQTYQAAAFSGGVDITPTVGPFNWSAVIPSLVTLTPLTTNGVANGQAQVTAKVPGMTQIVASIANTNSLPMTFIGCPVERVSLALTNGGGNLIDAAKGASTSVTATVLDVAQNSLTTVPLTWTSLRPSVSTAPTGTSVAVMVAGTNPGGTAYSAACIPTSTTGASCNANLYPMLAIYPPLPIGAAYSGTSSAASPAYVTTANASCASDLNCVPIVATVTSSSTAPTPVAALGAIPNSFLFNGAGVSAYLGSPKGLITLDTSKSTATINNTVTGQVIAVSPNGSKVIVADTQSTFRQVFVHDTGTGSQFSFPIASDASSAVAAFSQDNLKAFIAVQAPSGNQLYVYSTLAPLQTVPLGRAATDAAFLPSSAFGFLAQPSDPVNGLSYLATCDDPYAPVLGSAQAPGSIFIRPLTSPIFAAADPTGNPPNNQGFITLSPPNIQLVAAKVNISPTGNGCGSSIGVSTNVVATVNLGQGTFTPRDFLVSSDGLKAYIVAPNFGSVMVYDILSQSTSSITLVDNPSPLAMALTSDGGTLYVSTCCTVAGVPPSNVGSVHVINTQTGIDTTQVSVPFDTLCPESTGGQAHACLPDLLLVKP